MCFDADSHPPVAPIAGAAVDGGLVTLTAADGNRLAAYHARSVDPSGPRMLVLPDIRGLFTFYEELALRFAEAGVAGLRADAPAARVFVVGFCFGGRLAFDAATLGLDLAGVIGFYGVPTGPRLDIPAPAEVAGSMACPVLGLFGGADQGIPADMIATFEQALLAAEVPHELVTYEGAPHSFFDRKAAEFGDASADAWRRTLGFVAAGAHD
jgi:carboxymethylenebutenolidase